VMCDVDKDFFCALGAFDRAKWIMDSFVWMLVSIST
jgi:hypothetical protein